MSGYQPAPAGESGSYGGGGAGSYGGGETDSYGGESGGYPPGESFEGGMPYPWRTSGESTQERRTPPRGPHGESTEIFPTVGPPESSDSAQ